MLPRTEKEVIVLLELLARFDEEQNVENLEMLQREGIKVIHGITGLKVHSKLALVEYHSKTLNPGFVYIGTGNFNESTAKYTGISAFLPPIPRSFRMQGPCSISC